MATKKEWTEAQLRKAKADDAVVYKVMLALLLLCFGIMGLRSVRSFYGTIGGFEMLDGLTLWLALGAFGAAAAFAVAAAVCKNKYVRAIFPWCVTVSLLAAVCCLVMRYSWTSDFPLLYLLCVAVLIQYIVLMLYRWEFFLVSLTTVSAGALFFRLSRGGGIDGLEIVMLVLLALVLIGSALCAFLAARNKGKLVLGKFQYAMFPRKFSPAIVYTACGLWLACTVAALLLGNLFSYYCMFAAVAVELIAAVYYTFQLN